MPNTKILLPLFGATLLPLAGCTIDAETDPSGEIGDFRSGDEGHGDHNCPGPAPIMQVGDFDGNGVVDAQDVDMLSDFEESGDYAAYFDMNVDGVLNGQDVAIVAQNIGQPGTARDAQMAQLWQTLVPYRDVNAALAAGYIPFTPDLRGHGIHFVNLGLTGSWDERGFEADTPEGLNYTADGELVAAFFYADALVDVGGSGSLPRGMYYEEIMPPDSFAGLMHHEWHNHVGACFGGATSPVPGFDQCMTKAECWGVGGRSWNRKFHMLHVWMLELNECGPFGGIDADVSVNAPEEPNHGACEAADVVHCVVVGWHDDGTPMCADASDGGHDH